MREPPTRSADFADFGLVGNQMPRLSLTLHTFRCVSSTEGEMMTLTFLVSSSITMTMTPLCVEVLAHGRAYSEYKTPRRDRHSSMSCLASPRFMLVSILRFHGVSISFN
jgi:hypothetical protein